MIARADSGQASVEVVAFIPLVLAVALALLSVGASHTAAEEAGQAAEAGALALLQGRDARAAANASLPAAARRRAEIAVRGTRVHVRVRPRLPLPIPGLADRLAADDHADAGPASR
jgi:hypothetical protein